MAKEVNGNVQTVGTVGGSVSPVGTVTGQAFPSGPQGFSAYEIWEKENPGGTVEEFLDSLRMKGYVHHQGVAADEWIIEHGLDRNVHVTVMDSAGTQVIGEIIHTDGNTIIIRFTAAFSGKAYLG